MGIFLNSITPYERYKMVVSSEYFVDKTAFMIRRQKNIPAK